MGYKIIKDDDFFERMRKLREKAKQYWQNRIRKNDPYKGAYNGDKEILEKIESRFRGDKCVE